MRQSCREYIMPYFWSLPRHAKCFWGHLNFPVRWKKHQYFCSYKILLEVPSFSSGNPHHTTQISAYWFCGTGTFLRFIGSEDRHISDYLDSHAEPAMHIRMAFAYPYCFPTPSLIYFRDCFQPHYFLHIYPSLITIQGPRIWGTKASPSPSRCLFWPCHDRELAYDLPRFIISLLFLLFSFGS